MIDLNKYLNNIELECESENDLIEVKAYQLDNKKRGDSTVYGIKNELGVDKIKSCDYFLEDDEKIFMVEISDFFRQFNNLKNSYSKIKACKGLDKKDLKLTEKYILPQKVIKSEIKNKFLNTLLILHYFDLLEDKRKKICLILAFCSNKNDLVRVLDTINRNLKNELQNLIDDIKSVLAKDIQDLTERYLKLGKKLNCSLI